MHLCLCLYITRAWLCWHFDGVRIANAETDIFVHGGYILLHRPTAILGSGQGTRTWEAAVDGFGRACETWSRISISIQEDLRYHLDVLNMVSILLHLSAYDSESCFRIRSILLHFSPCILGSVAFLLRGQLRCRCRWTECTASTNS